jgi:hypothetical protein
MSTFNTDSYIEIGNSHNVCEDHALNGTIHDIPFIVISDGCSSSKETDFGSRILTHSFVKSISGLELFKNSPFLKEDNKILLEFIKNSVLSNIRTVCNLFNLPYDICDATLLFAFVLDDRLYWGLRGDGNIFIKFKNYSTWINIKFTSGAPYYLSYDLSNTRNMGYLSDPLMGKNNSSIKRSIIDFSNSGKMLKTEDELSIKTVLFESISLDDFQYIMLSSDGMETYNHSHKRLCADPKPSQEEIDSLVPFSMIERFSAYKNFNGEFVKRRMKRLKQEINDIRAEHFDDISCATLYKI